MIKRFKNEVARFIRTNADEEETLIVFEYPTYYRGEVWKSGFPNWHSNHYHWFMSGKFYEKYSDKDLFRVCEYFGFKMSDEVKEL